MASLTLVVPAGLGEDINADHSDGFVAGRRRELKGVLELLFADQGLVNRKLVDDVLRYMRLDGVEAALRTVAGAIQRPVTGGRVDAEARRSASAFTPASELATACSQRRATSSHHHCPARHRSAPISPS